MRKRRRTIYILIFSIIIYFILNYFYQNIVIKSKLTQIYVLNTNARRGDIINIDNLSILEVSSDMIEDDYVTKNEEVLNKIAIDNYNSGQILLNSMLIDEDKYISGENLNEIVSLKIEDISDSVSSQIRKGNIVNIYYTGKIGQAKDIINSINNQSIFSGNSTDGYITALLFQNIKVIKVLNKVGVEITVSDKNSDNILIDSILIQTSKENILKINNLKKYGIFSLSIIR